MTTRRNARQEVGAMTDDGIRFSLFAPRVHQVAIQGSWNDFKSVPMAKATDGVWWISFPLNDGVYQYRFEITRDEGKPSVIIPDPTAVYFSDDTLEYSTVTILNGQPIYYDYRWQHDESDLPPNEQLILYELHVGNFLNASDNQPDAPGTFDRVIEKLEYLVELGVNAIELMPVTQSAPEDLWGYSQHSLYAVNRRYGTPDELARLIDQCHKHGLRVFQDGVYNHMHEDAVITKFDYPYWFYEVNPDKPELQFGPKFNYENNDADIGVYPAREHALGALHRWVGTFHMDGIRFDGTRALKHFDVIGWFHDEAYRRTGFKPFFTIAEHIPQDPKVAGPDSATDAAWHDLFYRQLNCTVLGIPYEDHEPFDTTELLRVLNAKTDGFATNYSAIHYINNHDQERTLYMLSKESGITGETAFRRNKLGASLLLTAPGIPMLYMGEEFGQINPRGQNSERQPLDWSLLKEKPNLELFQHYQKLITFRKETPAICSDNFAVLADLPDHSVIAFRRWDDADDTVIVVANLRDEPVDEVRIKLTGIEGDRWRDVLQESEVDTKEQQLVTPLAESEVKIFVRA
jgi:1,4-alpha-glucan branching enzyme